MSWIVFVCGGLLGWCYGTIPGGGWRRQVPAAILSVVGVVIVSPIAFQMGHTAPRWQALLLFLAIWFWCVFAIIKDSTKQVAATSAELHSKGSETTTERSEGVEAAPQYEAVGIRRSPVQGGLEGDALQEETDFCSCGHHRFVHDRAGCRSCPCVSFAQGGCTNSRPSRAISTALGSES